jgi:ubiquitin-protein ligase
MMIFRPYMLMLKAQACSFVLIKYKPFEKLFKPSSSMSILDLAAGTPYENGVFRMKLLLSHDFPHSPPKGLLTLVIIFKTRAMFVPVSQNFNITSRVNLRWKQELLYLMGCLV